MIFAAGLGTRLRPLSNNRPKALVEVCGRTLLEITLTRLRDFGLQVVVINVHHFADMILEYLETHDNFGMRIELSREDVLLDTGGGLKKAAWFFDGDPFILHNVDVISTIDFRRMMEVHNRNQPLATLAVKDRKSTRYLLFDGNLELCGRRTTADEKTEVARTAPHLKALAFSGIHVISPRLLGLMAEDGAFSIIATYLRLAGRGEKILGLRADEYYWRDVGRPESVIQAGEDLKAGLWS